MRANRESDAGIRFPEVLPELTTRRVLVMGQVDGRRSPTPPPWIKPTGRARRWPTSLPGRGRVAARIGADAKTQPFRVGLGNRPPLAGRAGEGVEVPGQAATGSGAAGPRA